MLHASHINLRLFRFRRAALISSIKSSSLCISCKISHGWLRWVNTHPRLLQTAFETAYLFRIGCYLWRIFPESFYVLLNIACCKGALLLVEKVDWSFFDFEEVLLGRMDLFLHLVKLPSIVLKLWSYRLEFKLLRNLSCITHFLLSFNFLEYL